MLTFLPVALLLISALAVYILRFFPRGTGYSWLTSAVMSFLVTGGVLAFHWISPSGVSIEPWRPFDPATADAIRFGWDSAAWPYGFAIAATCMAVLLTAGARLHRLSNPLTWATNLTIAAAGLTAILAQTPLALVLALVPLDLLDLLMVLRLSRDWKYSSRGVMAFIVRCLSSFSLLGALVIQRTIGVPLEFENLVPRSAYLVIFAIGLRLGFLPLNLPYAKDIPFQRGLISFLRLSAYAAGLAALARIPQLELSGSWSSIISVITILTCFYGAIKWLFATDEINGRPFWLLTLSGFAFLSVLNGKPSESIAWGLVMITSGGVLFLYSARARGLQFLPILGLAALSGLPFTPASTGWAGVIGLPFDVGDAIVIITLALLMVGYIKHSIAPGENLYSLEVWARGFYPLGLTFIAVTGWIASILGLPGTLSLQTWWPSAVAMLITVFISFIYWRIILPGRVHVSSGVVEWINTNSKWIRDFFSLGWFFSFLWWLYRGLRSLVGFLSLLFEGEGGLLWTFLLLTLVMTILSARTGL